MRLPARHPIHHRSLLNLGRDLIDEAFQHPKGKGCGKDDIGKNKPYISVSQAEQAEQNQEWNSDNHCRDTTHREDRERHHMAAGAVTGKADGRHAANYEGNQGGDA